MRNTGDSLTLRVIGRVLSVAIIAGALVVTAYVQWLTYHEPRTDDAAVRANVVGIAPHVSGPLVELNVVDNQEVKQGEILFIVDPRPFEVELESSRARLLLAKSEVEALSNAILAATAEVQRLEDESTYASDHAARLKPLVKDQFVTQDTYEAARVKKRSALAAVERGRQELQQQKSLLAQFGEVNARVNAAEAAVHDAELNLTYCYVRAPFDARITNLNISVGEYARAGQPVFALVDIRAWYVLANFQETYLDSIRPGMPVDVFLMSYPNRLFRGTVQGLGWAIHPEDGATIGVLPAVQPTLNWVRLAQRIPVRILLEEANPERPYRMGMTAVVTVRRHRDGDGAAPDGKPR